MDWAPRRPHRPGTAARQCQHRCAAIAQARCRSGISRRRGRAPVFGCRQFEPPSDTPEQVAAQRAFELAELPADGLGEVQPLGGARDAAGFGDVPEIVELLVVEHERCGLLSVCNESIAKNNLIFFMREQAQTAPPISGEGVTHETHCVFWPPTWPSCWCSRSACACSACKLYPNEQGLNRACLLPPSWVSAGVFISLAMSKWMAKKSVGAQVISAPRTPTNSGWCRPWRARQRPPA